MNTIASNSDRTFEAISLILRQTLPLPPSASTVPPLVAQYTRFAKGGLSPQSEYTA